jgi:hypothetical protein
MIFYLLFVLCLRCNLGLVFLPISYELGIVCYPGATVGALEDRGSDVPYTIHLPRGFETGLILTMGASGVVF